MADVVKRLHYFNSQFLRATDFTAEQDYHKEMRRLHNRLLHTWGIAAGLGVTFSAGASAVTVGQGTAFDIDGRELVLAQDRLIEFSGAAGNLFLTIAYREEESDETSETGGVGNTRWTEDPAIDVSPTEPASTDIGRRIVLARVNWSGTQVSGVDNSVRRSAGVVGGDLQVRSLTLSSDTVDPSQWPRAQLGAAGRADFTGSLQVSGDLSVGGTLSGKLAAGGVNTEQIAGGAVTAAKIADLSVGTAKLANNAVVAAKIADLSIGTTKLAAGAVTADKIQDLTVGTAELADGAVTAAKIAGLNVGTDQIANLAVTEPKLANAAVSSRVLADESIIRSKLKFQMIKSGSFTLGAGGNVLQLVEANAPATKATLYFPLATVGDVTGSAGQVADVEVSIVYRRSVGGAGVDVHIRLRNNGAASAAVVWVVMTFAAS